MFGNDHYFLLFWMEDQFDLSKMTSVDVQMSLFLVESYLFHVFTILE
jgi:hypothetical protein